MDYLGRNQPDLFFSVTGPSTRAVRFTVGSCRIWGIGMPPLGWARFVGLPAAGTADRVLNGQHEPALARFLPLAQGLYGEERAVERELACLTDFFLALDAGLPPVPDAERIVAVHAALVDHEVSSVAQLVERVGFSHSTLERLCHRAFGFAPKQLLRRQRFIRSLAQYMLDPSLKWIGALDGHYHDQAQFVREFRAFMGMSPRQYAALDLPVLRAATQARQRLAGAPMQALTGPVSPEPIALGRAGS
ncbi:MAG TPA: helix-turn-helix domain-containing protein [Novosphingobium sp.]|nr:helix-turn-helix domain-containing protein [Novosphingobium sp.]